MKKAVLVLLFAAMAISAEAGVARTTVKSAEASPRAVLHGAKKAAKATGHAAKKAGHIAKKVLL